MAFTALRDSEGFARSVGINAYKYKIIVFGISSFLAGLMGGFYAHYVGLISHHLVGLDLIILLLVILIVGGLGKFPGAVVATLIMVFLNEYLRPLNEFRQVVLGAIVIVSIILLPGGIADGMKLLINRFSRKEPDKLTS
jgi:branched-chain amino acid transport system permease protein